MLWVSIHAPARGATTEQAECLQADAVSIHAPARGATGEAKTRTTAKAKFQSTRPRGARPNQPIPVSSPTTFQSTRPRGARPRQTTEDRAPLCFNPRAREGRDAFTSADLGQSIVSIHAPARGATKSGSSRRRMKSFQSTRPRGARPGIDPNLLSESLFQSTRPRGARPGYGAVFDSPSEVSIHAPARGATKAGTDAYDAVMFQSTRPRGARQTYAVVPITRGEFQSTRPRGARLMRSATLPECHVSIHAPARGATALL